ncbi:PREDICTED: uncharacterized mitochondrial protein AtMg00810-like [Brassica oleracea var. oleracea]|uniref:uncharacterized mitochondrial protein AtMg00810-like n=1 Tax=Brassica oleracea var. oleracea TaxID=109376 RepID=UPI0006A717CC|nr:PREDICTED: uncharacterized mitochondrial protein AtMg00810-like [Brassica oleracea var. oleracea]
MQRKYITDLLTKLNMSSAKPVATPMQATPKLALLSGTALKDPKEYRMVLGSLQYLSLTRPDIAFVVNHLSQYMHRPTDLHWQAIKRILRYLAGTSSHGALRVQYVSIKDQLADSLTKPVPRPRFIELKNKIGVKALPPS